MPNKFSLSNWIGRLLGLAEPESSGEHSRAVDVLKSTYGLRLIETDPKGNARPWRSSELSMLQETLRLLGPAFYSRLSIILFIFD